jgi:type I restriction enzyme S subunit
MSDVKYVEEDYDPLRANDVLFNNTNSPVLVGKTAHISKDEEWAYSNHMTRIRGFSDSVDPKWVAHWLHFLFEDGYFRMHCRNHVNQASIGVRFLENKVDVPVPPLPEQRRIVAKIEELFSNLNAGRADLQTAQRQLERYRLSVLQAAVEGRLSAAWRRTHAPEPADALLDRILDERRNSSYRRKPSLEPIDTDELSAIPESWTWTRVGAVCYVRGGKAFRSKHYQDEGIPLVRISNIQGYEVSFEERAAYLPRDFADENERYLTQVVRYGSQVAKTVSTGEIEGSPAS